jgi:hypothetical protein
MMKIVDPRSYTQIYVARCDAQYISDSLKITVAAIRTKAKETFPVEGQSNGEAQCIALLNAIICRLDSSHHY